MRSACDDATLKQRFHDELGIELKASFNPWRNKAIMEDLPHGIAKITPYGVPICLAGHEMDYQGIRYATETLIYRAPQGDDGLSVCIGCPERPQCCNRSTAPGRTITVSLDTLKQIDPGDPPMAKRFKAMMARRPSVERMIKRLKCDLGDDRLSKRGNASFQAYLDKTMISYHLLIRHFLCEAAHKKRGLREAPKRCRPASCPTAPRTWIQRSQKTPGSAQSRQRNVGSIDWRTGPGEPSASPPSCSC